MVIFALIFAIALLGCNFEHMKAGLGYHIWDVKTVDYMTRFQIVMLQP